MNGEGYPRSYTGEELTQLGLNPEIAEIVRRVEVPDATEMVIVLNGEVLGRERRVRATLRPPHIAKRSWTIRVELNQIDPRTGRAVGPARVVAEDFPTKAVDPQLPDPTVIEDAVIAAGEADPHEHNVWRTMLAVHNLLMLMCPDGRVADWVDLALVQGGGSLAIEQTRDGWKLSLTLVLKSGAPSPSEIFGY